MRSVAEACVSERCYRRRDDSQPRFDKSVPSKVFFIISMFSNGSFTPEFTRGLHTFDLMQKCCFCIWWLMLTCCYDVNVALQVANKDKNINANNSLHWLCSNFPHLWRQSVGFSQLHQLEDQNKTPESSAFVVQWATKSTGYWVHGTARFKLAKTAILRQSEGFKLSRSELIWFLTHIILKIFATLIVMYLFTIGTIFRIFG